MIALFLAGAVVGCAGCAAIVLMSLAKNGSLEDEARQRNFRTATERQRREQARCGLRRFGRAHGILR